jgi:prepilin-type N-terminal cleavage/methylation domain-containing protein
MRPLTSERGTTLIEVMVASAILLIVLSGLLSMVGLATNFTENHGHLEARTAEYAQDKMEQLLALAYTDSTSDTANTITEDTGGTGLAAGGSSDPGAPVDGYTDWVADDGNILGGGGTPIDGWFYERVWQITSMSGSLKEIAVTVTVRSAVGNALKAKSTVVALKGSEF